LDDIDERFMSEALRLARRGLGRTSPNPAVGAVIVRMGKVIARGYHQRAGGPHAEVQALAKLGGKAERRDILYVTLEPCNHYGRTPPCTEAILKSGIGNVVVGMRDPNPRVTGGGCEYLAQRGVKVRIGILERECRRLNEFFVKFVSMGRPFVVAKSALTLDGWSATSTGHSQWVTNQESREFVHRLRDMVDAVMVGIETILADDPLLNTRLKNRKGKDPVRIILDTNLRIPEDARVLNQDSQAITLIVAGEHTSEGRQKKLRELGASILLCPTREGRIDLQALMDKLSAMSITSILVEGGATLMGALIREKLIDKFYVFKAPKILGGSDGIPMAVGPGPKKLDQCLVLRETEVKRFVEDLLVIGYPEYGANDKGLTPLGKHL
jgi:diaminohydroxyphosphoribosylaminopyrimidine deaminase/5-amino-6-(5-phosphoribosylamino)uracil reductase